MITERILVVDDEESVCQSVKKILSRKGYSVNSVQTVEDAVNTMNEIPFDLVITDLMMPKSGGMDLLQIVRDHYPELEVVMITGYASIESAVKATKLGAAGYLPKPFTPDELTGIAEKALLAKRNRPQARTASPLQNPATDTSSDVIDVDMPFNAKEVASVTSPAFVEALTHSDVPVSKKKSADKAFCVTGSRECRRLVLEGRECAGECPIEKKERDRAAKTAGRTIHTTKELIDVDMPFPVEEMERVMESDYMMCLDHSDVPRAALYGRRSVSKRSVLVVDDEPIVCHSVRRILSKQRCSVEEVFDVDTALQKMKLNSYNLILLDLNMPKHSGMEVLRSIKKQYPSVPVVMVTGYASIETAIEAINQGATNFIPKPFSPEELTKVTEEAFAA